VILSVFLGLEKMNVFFSDEEVVYPSKALEKSNFTKEIKLIDKKSELDINSFEKIKKIEIYPSNSMNFINSYNDTLHVVFSFPKRECLDNSISSYLWNFSTSKQYIIIHSNTEIKIDSMEISHETRPVGPVDCLESLIYPNSKSLEFKQ
jgi:hypothetical protein